LLFLVSGFPAFGQSDSLLSPQKFFEAVALFHPLVRQANLFQQAAEQELMMNRGQLDPKLNANFIRKSFDGKDYYNLFNPELKIATWPGIDVKAGFERNVGTNISDEDVTPLTGLQYVGVGLPLGQGLFTDVRRTTIKQAKIGLQMAEAERIKQVNKIVFSAAKDYWEWYFNKEQLTNADEAFRFASERYRAVVQRIIVGDLAPIDSVEAFIFLQDREIFMKQSRFDELNSRLQLSTHLWSADAQPLELGETAKPEIPAAFMTMLSDSLVKGLMTAAKTQHPEIQKFRFKLNQLDLDRRLGKEMLKPSLNLNYTWLSRTDNSVWATNTIDRNYKFGFDFGFPILLRKERGKLGLVQTKILQTQLEQSQTIRNIEIDITTSFNDLKILENLIELQRQMVDNYLKLRNAEVKKFENGESSLFLINSRESKLIEGKIKLAALISKYQKEKAGVYYAAGRNPFTP
jgi:outer membrane protein TolC